MSARKYTWYQILIQKSASTRAGAWFFARTAHRLDRLFHKLSGGRTMLVTIVSGLPAMWMTTTGAKSGLPRTSSLVYIRDGTDGDQIAIVASNLGQHHFPGWYYNLKANPHATCVIDGQKQAYVAHEAEDEEYARYWRATLETFPGYGMYQKRAGRRIPIMVLEENDV